MKTVRNFSKVGDSAPIPRLVDLQTVSYARFLQEDADSTKRKGQGLEELLREVFPIVSYDETMELEYVSYDLSEPPRYTPQECRDLKRTYGKPFRITCRLKHKEKSDVLEENIYVGEMPIMIGGGEFIINGAERVIVSQLHRSPGIDFTVELEESDRPLHSARVIPERGSWIELNVTKKDSITMRIDQSSKIPATMFLRAVNPECGETSAILRMFYPTKQVTASKLTANMYLVESYIDPDTGEELVRSGGQCGDAITQIQATAKGKIEVIGEDCDPLILNTIAEDPSTDHDTALLRLYARLRPGNPPQLEKAKVLFEEKFFDENRYRLGKVGRFRINRKFGETDTKEMTLEAGDFINTMGYLLALRGSDAGPINKSGETYVRAKVSATKNRFHKICIDDIDHLGNRRLRTIDELAAEEIRKGFLKLRRTVQERMSLKDPEEITKIADLVNSKALSSSIDYFFGRGELSQVVDQQNPLAQLTHERRLSALGPGGLNRKRAGFEVRDVHISHYGRICPIETPEGNNIGLISSMGIYCDIDEYGFLITPYIQVHGRKIDRNPVMLRADQESEAILAPPEVLKDAKSRGDSESLPTGRVLARVHGELSTSESKDVGYIDISPKQTVGVSASLIPFLEHDDANRALMGSNMQRQAVPLLRAQAPLVSTGMEPKVVENSSFVVKARKPGVVTYVDGERIVVDNADEYEFRKFEKLNERACLNQRPLVNLGEKVKKDQIIADGSSCDQGQLALGQNVLVAFMPYDGYNFEDAILISEKLVRKDTFTSIHLEEYDVEIRETKLGKEEFTRDIPNVSEKALRYLDEFGVVQVGTRISNGDILVGKVSPKSKSELSPEEKLLHAIFGRAGEDVKNDSLELPAGEEGVVVGTKRFSRKASRDDDQKKQVKKDIKVYSDQMNDRMIKVFHVMIDAINELLDVSMIDPMTRQKVGQSDKKAVLMEQIEMFNAKWIKGSAAAKTKAADVYDKYWPRLKAIEAERDRKSQRMADGDELPTGVLEKVKVTVATKRKLGVGDKMAGRHGNKGVIARILPEADMPFLEDGTPVEILLNPLGVPGRMNLGQILETHLGWAAEVLGFQAVTPVFDGATEAEIFECIDEANEFVRDRRNDLEVVQGAGMTEELLAEMPLDGKVRLCDGRTGEPFEQKTTVGYIYMNKLHHLVDEKVHARATGPYSLITQQPLGGKARTGGQRFGEMEVWGLEAYGASYTLQELLTVKSDDVEGRTKIYESMVKGQNTLEAGTPVSFDVLCNELRGLGLNIQLEKKKLL
ncbi:MAG: DNA-directed RNA polymerase subunit beta [Phycisphaerales bacterium]|jgi:DNA-directed RNA polymerase subunit beta|nr:DNA-directed RNA polymerase subunit beta [Phycisphaerales bacterium]